MEIKLGIKHVNLLLVTSYCKDLGEFRFAADIKTFGAFLVQEPQTIDFSKAPKIQYNSLKMELFLVKTSECKYVIKGS